jgi:hypothetical protein
MKQALRTVLTGWAVVAIGCATVVSSASANDRFLLDKKAETPGHVALLGNGTADVAWTDGGGAHADYAEFCRIPKGGKCKNPVKLPNPAGNAITESVSGAFPVVAGNNVAVVAPRYVRNDLVIWSSSNGGKTFDAGTILSGYSNKSNPTDVIPYGPVVFVGANNPGLGFSYGGLSSAAFTFSLATGTVQGSSLTLDGDTLYESYWTQDQPKYHVRYFHDSAADSGSEGTWAGPHPIATGYGGELASGSSGTFAVTQDYAGRKYPTAIKVRQLVGSIAGSATTLANDKKTDLFALGDISEAPNGHVAVAWPLEKKSGKMVLRLFESKTGTSFGKAKPIAHLGNAYAIGDNLQLAYGSDGTGVTTFLNSSGLHLADLKKLK